MTIEHELPAPSPPDLSRLFFLNPDVRQGLNLTVRNGTKWFGAKPGTKVDICETPSGPGEEIVSECSASIIATQVINLATIEVPALIDLLTWEHAEECQTLSGLNEAMDEAYGAGEWGPEVTFVWFTV